MARYRRGTQVAVVALIALAGSLVLGGCSAVTTEAQLRAAYSNTSETFIQLRNDITLTDCTVDPVDGFAGALIRRGGAALTLDGGGHTITQTCPSNVLFDNGGALTLNNLTLTGGHGSDPGSGRGGGAMVLADFSADHLTVTGNSTSPLAEMGGGLYVQNDTKAVITNSIITDNVANGSTNYNGMGGGVFAYTPELDITNTTIAGNTAADGGFGGGIFAEYPGGDGASVVLVSSTVSNNIAAPGDAGNGPFDWGGGIRVDAGKLTAINSTITGNVAQGPEGMTGGIQGATDLVDSTVVGNSAATGPANISSPGSVVNSVVALPRGGAPNCGAAATASSGGNFSDDASCGFTNTTAGDHQSAGDPMLGALANNGGATFTMLPGPGSPLIDALTPAQCTAGAASTVTTDQRGTTRPQGPGCDVGAVEVVA